MPSCSSGFRMRRGWRERGFRHDGGLRIAVWGVLCGGSPRLEERERSFRLVLGAPLLTLVCQGRVI